MPAESMPSGRRVIDTINTVVQLLILRKVLGLLLGPEGKNSPSKSLSRWPIKRGAGDETRTRESKRLGDNGLCCCSFNAMMRGQCDKRGGCVGTFVGTKSC